MLKAVPTAVTVAVPVSHLERALGIGLHIEVDLAPQQCDLAQGVAELDLDPAAGIEGDAGLVVEGKCCALTLGGLEFLRVDFIVAEGQHDDREDQAGRQGCGPCEPLPSAPVAGCGQGLLERQVADTAEVIPQLQHQVHGLAVTGVGGKPQGEVAVVLLRNIVAAEASNPACGRVAVLLELSCECLVHLFPGRPLCAFAIAVLAIRSGLLLVLWLLV